MHGLHFSVCSWRCTDAGAEGHAGAEGDADAGTGAEVDAKRREGVSCFCPSSHFGVDSRRLPFHPSIHSIYPPVPSGFSPMRHLRCQAECVAYRYSLSSVFLSFCFPFL